MMVLRREDLERAVCRDCRPDEHKHERLFLHARCHPSDGTRVSYEDGQLTVACRRCKFLIAVIEVAS
jgi:hypothetical protein